jgi:ParB-like chromosome segregation protein Spo0J
MLVNLKDLKPNPFRDFAVDPIDEDQVEKLTASIKSHEFWPGVLCRRVNGHFEIAAGHHHVRAAMKAGIKTADIPIYDWSDLQMIQVMGRENATHRGSSSTAQAGTVISAVRLLAKSLEVSTIVHTLDWSDQEVTQAKTALGKEDGLGYRPILRLLREDHEKDDEGWISQRVVRQQLENLKASGHYTRVIGELRDEIERDNKERIKALKRAEEEARRLEEQRAEAEARQREAAERRKEAARLEREAKEEADKKRAAEQAHRAELEQRKAQLLAEAAKKRQEETAAELKQFAELRKMRDTANNAAEKSKRDKTFDLSGVAKYFKNDFQLETFRDYVTRPDVLQYLPVNRQADLARKIVSEAKEELTAKFIKDRIYQLIFEVKQAQRKADQEAKERLLRQDWESKARAYQAEFASGVGKAVTAILHLIDHEKRRPKGVTLLITSEFRDAMKSIENVIACIRKAGIV